jgi:anthranilate 1,2-dioxygenase large subunit
MTGNGMSSNGTSGSGAGIGARDDAVLLDRQYVWPGDLTEIPDWVYTDESIYRREVERIFHGRTWNYVALEAEIPNAGDFIRSNVGPTTVVVARTRDGGISVVENRCVHRCRILP